MRYRPEDEFGDTWNGLVPEQPNDERPWLRWLLIAALGLVVICLCGAGSYLLVREFVFNPLPTAPVAVPTQIVLTPELGPPANTIVAQSPLPTSSPAIAATATIAPQPTIQTATEPTLTPAADINVEAVRLPAPPAIDGLLGEWDEVPAYRSSFIVHSIEGWDGSDDLDALWRLAWDNNNLYIGVEVADDIHVQTQTGQTIFRGDSLDIQLDTDRAGDFAPGLSPDDFQFIFSPGDFVSVPPVVVRFRGTASGQIPEFPGHAVIYATTSTSGGYFFEAAIPWSNMNVVPAEGLVIGIALNANDNDTPGTAAQEVMKSHVASRTLTDPTGWGTLTLR